MPKLTLSVDPGVASRAKRYARQHGTSVSRMVENYLARITEASGLTSVPPVLQSLRGILKKADPQDYRRHLARKYR